MSSRPDLPSSLCPTRSRQVAAAKRQERLDRLKAAGRRLALAWLLASGVHTLIASITVCA